jgi:predicted XRE-type DNA-binding protein
MKERRFGSVWDAIESSPTEAANMKARADVMIAIRQVVDKWKMTQPKRRKSSESPSPG